MYLKIIFLVLQILVSFTYCDLSLERKEKLLNGFIDFYNNLPDEPYTCEEGTLQSAEPIDDNNYNIEITLRVADVRDTSKYMKCSATVQDLQDQGVTVVNNNYRCTEIESKPVIEEPVVTESAFVRKPVHLDNEVETNTAVTSGEQFIAVPREEPGVSCIGCATHINPQAAGVTELATLAVRHLDRHEPNVRHKLNTVLDVERQVQVVNGVRYILTLLVDYNNCTQSQDDCESSNVCKISVLEKPWIKLPRGGKYRAILANNCTQDWQFGDNGEVINENESNNKENNEVDIHPNGDDIIKAVHTEDVQAQQNQGKTLTDEEVKTIEEQIIPHSEFNEPSTSDRPSLTQQSDENVSKKHVFKASETGKPATENSINPSLKKEESSISEERKKTIDDLMHFFEFAGFGSETGNEKNTRMKRSFDRDIEAMLLTEDFQSLQKSISRGKYLYDLAQVMVDYLNEMDLVIKSRTLKSVVKADDENVNYQHFYYIQARVIIPCDKAVCEPVDTTYKICNGVIEATDKQHPHVLTAFCYDEEEEEETELNKVNFIPFDDPVLNKLLQDSVKKMEKESTKPNALNISEIISATTQKVSGTLTKMAIVIQYLNCSKDTPLGLRKNCSVAADLGSNVCEVVIHEKYALKERKIIYNCIERPVDVSYSGRINRAKINVDDIKLKEMIQEALQYLELQSNRNNKQKIVAINSVETQLNAGLVTEIQFVVGYTSCSSNTDVDVSTCPLLPNNPLRKCKAQIWDRTWIEDGRQFDVKCDDVSDEKEDNNTSKQRKKRSLVGESAKDVKNPKYKTLAQESLQKYLQTTGNTKRHTVVSVDNVTEKLVAGLLTRLDFTVKPMDESSNDVIICHSEIWDRPWLNVKEITVDCKLNDKSYRAKRQLPGGVQNQDPNKPEYKQLAEESLQKYLQTAGNSKPHEVIQVNKASEQVVAGILTQLEFTVKPIGGDSGDVTSCTSEIWDRPWLKKKEITVDCKIDNESNQMYSQRFKREMSEDDKQVEVDFSNAKEDKKINEYRTKRSLRWVGGESAKDVHDPKYKTLAEKSLQQYLQTTGDTKSHEVISVDKVSVQVVAGSLTRLEFTVKPVDASLEDIFACNSKIWDRPWLNKTEITVDCKIDDKSNQAKTTRRKREILHDAVSPNVQSIGDSDEQDPNKSQYKALAQDALGEYQRLKHSRNAHKVVEVKSVHSKVVSGLIYEIEFTAVPTSCPTRIFNPSLCKRKRNSRMLLCHTRIWNQSWLKSKQITVVCNPDTTRYRKKRSLGLEPESEFIGNEIENNIKDKRQVLEEEEVIDEELKYYYADRAMQHINQVSNTNNLNKLISIHAVDSSLHMGTNMVRLYIETAETFCLKHADENNLPNCEELDGMTHKLCQVRLWPSPDDELVVQSISVVCDDDKNFATVTGLSISDLLTASIKYLESSPDQKFKLVHLGEPQVIPSLDSAIPHKISFIIAFTNCTKDVDIRKTPFQCFLDSTKTSKPCTSYIWFAPNSREISHIDVKCLSPTTRRKRSVTMNLANATADDLQIHQLVQEALEKLEMSSIHRYKQRLLLINSYSSKITTGKVTTIDFDVGYTSCLKYEWVDDESTCEFLEHLPRRHCVAHVFERLWLQNGRNIDVNCEDDETPLEAHIEFESAEMAMQLANQALRHIEAKYPHPRKQKVVRIFSLEKQVVAGIHYRLKIEVGNTDCPALSAQTDCKIVKDEGMNKFCRINVWLRPWTDHPPKFRVSCDYQETATSDTYHDLQAEHLFYDFLSTHKPEYVNDRNEIRRRFEIFKNNIIKIHELNTHERGTATYGVTQFADLTYEEFTTRHMGLKTSLRNENQVPFTKAKIPEVSVPESFDWRDRGAVTEVKNQGSCGSCWAFSVTGNIEGQWKLHSGNLVSLSEQELVDCDKLDDGCNGGLPDNAYRAIEQLGGLETENDYPYEAEDDKCTFNKTLARVQISGAVNISSNETEMSKWLVQNGPISIGINANAMQFYMGGISHPWKMLCNPSNLDHGVLIVGYGIKNYPLFHKRLPFWTIKNSWGTSWGEQGYYRVYRGDGTCGVNQMASSAVI